MTVSVMATHVVTQHGTVLHVRGNRLEVIQMLEDAWKMEKVGVNLHAFSNGQLPETGKGPYRPLQMWIGMGQVSKLVILDHHLIEVDETPLAMDETPPPAPTAGDELIVEL